MTQLLTAQAVLLDTFQAKLFFELLDLQLRQSNDLIFCCDRLSHLLLQLGNDRGCNRIKRRRQRRLGSRIHLPPSSQILVVYVVDPPVFMRLFATSYLFQQWAFCTTFASSLRSDRCRRSTVQTPRASTARDHLPMSANAIALAPCGAHRPIGCCYQKKESSCDLFSNWQTKTDGRFEGSAATCRQQEHKGH